MLHTIKGRLNDAKCCIQEALRDHAQGPEDVDWEFVARLSVAEDKIRDAENYTEAMLLREGERRGVPLDDALYPAAMAMAHAAGAQVATHILAERSKGRRKPAKGRK